MKDRFAAIDGLRGVAIIFVTLHHTAWTYTYQLCGVDFTPYFQFGNNAVSLFFALSGFCLFYPIIRDGYHANWRQFYARRALRIIPAYYVALIVWSIVRHSTIQGHEVYQWVTHLTFLHPLFRDTMTTFTSPFWFIGAQEQIIWLFPLLVLAMCRWPMRAVLVMGLVSVGLQYGLSDAKYFWHYAHQAPAHVVEFGVGMGAAMLLVKGYTRHVAAAWILGWFGLIVAPWIHACANTGPAWWRGDILFTPCWGALVYACVVSAHSLPARLLSVRPLVMLGTISYSLYLYNGISWYVPGWLHVARQSAWWWPVAMSGLLAFGIAGYFLIEKPFFALRARLRNHTGRPVPLSGPERSAPVARRELPRAGASAAASD